MLDMKLDRSDAVLLFGIVMAALGLVMVNPWLLVAVVGLVLVRAATR